MIGEILEVRMGKELECAKEDTWLFASQPMSPEMMGHQLMVGSGFRKELAKVNSNNVLAFKLSHLTSQLGGCHARIREVNSW